MEDNYIQVRSHLRKRSGGFDIQQEHQPDTQAMPQGDDESDALPMGSVTEGMTASTMAEASASDVERGFFIVGSDVVNRPPNMPREGDDDPYPPTQEPGGFAGRPGGWER